MFSLFALYCFALIVKVFTGWQLALITTAAFWIISNILNIKEYLGKLR